MPCVQVLNKFSFYRVTTETIITAGLGTMSHKPKATKTHCFHGTQWQTEITASLAQLQTFLFS